jgi:hypothetical protein
MGESMLNKITFSVVWAGMILVSVMSAGQLCSAEASAEDEDLRVVSMEADPPQKNAAGAKPGSGDWEEIFKANNHDKLTGNDKQIKKAELAEDFDADILDQERRYDWYGAREDCSSKGRLPTHKELLKIWAVECKESTSAVCSAAYWTSEKKDERALAVNFLNGYVVAKDLDAFAYVRCVGAKQVSKPAAARPSAKDAKKKGVDPSLKIIDFVRNYRPMPDGPNLDEKMQVAITGAGGSTGAVSWEVRKKGGGLFLAVAVVPVDEGELKFTYSVNTGKKIVSPADARAKAVFKSITDPDIEDGDMH